MRILNVWYYENNAPEEGIKIATIAGVSEDIKEDSLNDYVENKKFEGAERGKTYFYDIRRGVKSYAERAEKKIAFLRNNISNETAMIDRMTKSLNELKKHFDI